MRIWKQAISVELLTAFSAGTVVNHLGMEFLEVGDDFIRARVPVDARTVQPYGQLHGGVSVVLAETLGSCGAAYCVPAGQRVVGLDISQWRCWRRNNGQKGFLRTTVKRLLLLKKDKNPLFIPRRQGH